MGEESGIRPHGLKALFGLRLEKGHVIVGMDTELDTTPRRVGMRGRFAWTSRRSSVARRSSGPPSSPTTAGCAGSRWRATRRVGSPIFVDGEIVGHVGELGIADLGRP